MTNLPVTTCYASCSIGANTSRSLIDKLKALSSAGFDGIELSFPDLHQYAQETISKYIAENDYERLSEAAAKLKDECTALNLKIFMLQPFSNFEGWRKDSPERADAFARATGWSKIMLAADIKLLQIGSSDAPSISQSPQELAADLAELADQFAQNQLSIAYENWCWAARAPSWEAIWALVKLADRPNLGLCLDTFQIAGSLWADPTTQDGLAETLQDTGQDATGQLLKSNLEALAREVPKDRIFIFQISDAYKMSPPLEKEEDGLAKSRWSHDWRPFPFDMGYLPVTQIAQAVFDTGFRGIVSMEVFDSKEEEKFGGDLERVARSGMEALEELGRKCALP